MKVSRPRPNIIVPGVDIATLSRHEFEEFLDDRDASSPIVTTPDDDWSTPHITDNASVVPLA